MNEENNRLREILQPQISSELQLTEHRLHSINTKLLAYETEFENQKEKHTSLENNLLFYRQFLQESKARVTEH